MNHRVLSFIAAAGATAPALAGIITTSQVVAYSLQPAPGTAGAFIFPAVSFLNAGIDADGRVWVYAKLFGGDVSASPQNDRGYWSGTNTSDLALVVRDGSQPAGMPAGVTINTNATTTGLGSTSLRMTSGDTAVYGVNFFGGGVTANINDSAIYVGNHLGNAMIARRGDQAPGTVGAAFNSAWRSFGVQNTTYNGNGRVAFSAALTGGDTVTANDAGIFEGPSGSIGMVARKGDTVEAGVTLGGLGFNVKQNANNQVMYDPTLAGAGVTTANDSTLYIHTPGFGNTRVYREGDPAPGTAGAILGANPTVGSKSFSNAGALLLASLSGGDTDTTNNQAAYLADLTGLHMVVRKGDEAPNADAFFNGFNAGNFAITNSGLVTIQGALTGETTGSDSGLWGGYAGNLRLIVREGDPAPGTAGATLDSLISSQFASNNNGQVVFNANLLGGDVTPGVNGSICYGYTPGFGLRTICRQGDSFEVTPGVFKTIGQMSVQSVDNAGGAAQSLNDLGIFCLQLTFTDSTNAVLRTFLPACLADFDCNGFVNGEDFDRFAGVFELGDAEADLNGDRLVSSEDYATFVAAFESGC